MFNYSRHLIMKKTILAVVTTSLFAASANAATVFDKDGQQVDVYGRIQYQAGQINNTAGKADNFGGDTLARFGFNAKSATGYNDVALISKLEWEVSSESDETSDKNSFVNRYAFMGADFANGIQATVGTQDSAFVELSDVTDVYNEYSGVIENQFDSRWDDSAKVTYTADGWDLRSSVSFSDAEKTNASNTKVQNEYSVAAGYTVKLDDVSSLKPVVAYQALTGEVAGESYTNEQYAAGLGYTYDAFYLASTYGQSVKDKVYTGTVEDTKDTVWAVTGTYKVLPAVTLVTGFGQIDPHNATSTGEDGTVTKYYVLGAQYDITAKAKAYTEYKINETANQDDNYYVGLQYNF
jgi:outer membrane pore protein F